MISALAFERLGFERLTAWANTRNGRSQRALERIGFRREGVLNAWHRHGDRVHDVVIFGMVRRRVGAQPAARRPRARSRARRRPRSSSAERTRVRCVATTQASTASAATTIAAVTVSPSTSADHASVRTGCASWIWPIFATPPSARPWYQAKKPRNIEITARRRSRATRRCPRGRRALAAIATGIDEERRGQHERPADHLPAAVGAAERAALGVPERAERDRAEHEQVGAGDARRRPAWRRTRARRSGPRWPRARTPAAGARRRARPPSPPSRRAAGRRSRSSAPTTGDAARATLKSGKPTTTPMPTSANRGRSRAVGERLAPQASRTPGERGGDERPPEPDERRVEILDRERVAGSENENAEHAQRTPQRRRALRYRPARR